MQRLRPRPAGAASGGGAGRSRENADSLPPLSEENARRLAAAAGSLARATAKPQKRKRGDKRAEQPNETAKKRKGKHGKQSDATGAATSGKKKRSKSTVKVSDFACFVCNLPLLCCQIEIDRRLITPFHAANKG